MVQGSKDAVYFELFGVSCYQTERFLVFLKENLQIFIVSGLTKELDTLNM